MQKYKHVTYCRGVQDAVSALPKPGTVSLRSQAEVTCRLETKCFFSLFWVVAHAKAYLLRLLQFATEQTSPKVKIEVLELDLKRQD